MKEEIKSILETVANNKDLIQMFKAEKAQRTADRLKRNEYGHEPLIEAIKRKETTQYLKAEAEANEKRRKARRRNREAREKAEAETPRTNPLKYISQYREEAEAPKIKELSNKSLIALYNSQRLIFKGEILTPNITDERILINYLKPKNPTAILRSNGERTEPTSNLKQLVLSMQEARTPKARNLLLDIKGESSKATNTITTQTGKEAPVLAYNNIGYEPNEFIFIGTEEDLKGLLSRFNSRNKQTDNFYNFFKADPSPKELTRQIAKAEEKGKDTAILKRLLKKAKAEEENPKERRRTTTTKTKTTIKTIRGNRTRKQAERMKRSLILNKDFITSQPIEEQAKIINKALFYEIKLKEVETETKTETIGLNEITDTEKEAIKKANRKPQKFETQEIARDLIKIAHEADGRQKQKNIEYDLRNNPQVKAIKAETSNNIYFIINEVEEEANRPTKAKATEKKEKALIKVLQGFKQTAELKEELQESIEEQLKEAETQHESHHNKKGKNKYNTKIGLTTPNRKPTHQERKYKKNNEELRNTHPAKLFIMMNKTEADKKAKINSLQSIRLLNEVRQEAQEETSRGKATAREREEARRRRKETARENNTRELKRIQEIREEVRREKKEAEARKTADPFQDLLRLLHEMKKEEQNKDYKTAQRIREQNKKAHQIKQEETEFIKSIYGDLKPYELKLMKADHKTETSFITGLELVIKESKRNIQRKYKTY